MRNYDLTNTMYAKSQIIKNKLKEALERKSKKYSIPSSKPKIIPKQNKNYKKNSSNNNNLIGNSSAESIFKTSLRNKSNIKEKEKKEKEIQEKKLIKANSMKNLINTNKNKINMPKILPIINKMKHPRYKLIKRNELFEPKKYFQYSFKSLVQYNRIICSKNGSKAYEDVAVEKYFPTCLVSRDKFSSIFQITKNDFPKLYEYKINIPINEEETNEKQSNEIDEEKRKKILLKFREKIIKCMLEYKRRKLDKISNLQFEKCTKEQYEKIIYELIYNKNFTYVKNKIKQNPSLCLYEDLFKQTILHIVSKKNLYQIIPLLIKYGSDVNAKTIAGQTPIHLASKFNCLESLQLLLINFGIPNLKDHQNKKPKDYNNELVFELILERASIVNYIFLIIFSFNFFSYILFLS